ncbi:SBBP repeat-containing protein [Pseudopedobacter beijingensis]|uniref:SBBP repeat-containing protein n=1 Tax=Pseudopedobacter beijingensis TaxID=1207056 RepID=A0ABW4I8G4_9SPHI
MYNFYKKYFRQYIYSLILCLATLGTAYAQDISWVNRYGAAGEDIIYASAVDFENNIYTTGTFNGSIDFNEGKGAAVQLSSQGGVDIFITKTAVDGVLLWAKRVGGTGGDYALALAVDDKGAIYITGRFTGTVDFDPGSGVFNLAATSGSYDVFVLKLNASGDFVWAKKMGGAGWDVANAIAVDKDKNVVVTGRFDGTANFNSNGSASAINLTAIGQDIFVVKLNSEGNTLWAKRYGGSQDDWGQGVDVDANGSIYVTGFFRDEVLFGGLADQKLISTGATRDVFILKIESQGELSWVKKIGGTSDDRGEALKVDLEGNILITGRIAGTNILFGDDFSLSPGGNFDAFIAKLNQDGDYIWVKSLEGSGDSFGLGLATDNYHSVYIAGYFKGIIDLNPGSCDLEFVSAGDADVFIVKLDADGYFVWGRQMGGINEDRGNTISVDQNANVYTAGYFTGEANFNANLGAHYIVSKGDKDAFLHKIAEKAESDEDNEPLPLYIVNLTGNVDENFNSLKWTLLNQKTNLSFDIERSNGTDAFSAISSLKSANQTHFFYIDNSPFDEHNYYRIKQIDESGEVFYSETLLLKRVKFAKNPLHVYPNPILNNLLTISRTDGRILGNIIINDSLGRLVFSAKEILVDKLSINTTGWLKGLYLIKVQDKTGSNHFKIIK